MKKSKLEAWRTQRGMTQRELAERVGVTQAYVSQIESGKRRVRDMRRPTQLALATVLGVDVKELVR